MNTHQASIRTQSTHQASDVGSLASVRAQIAVIRALLDELERVPTSQRRICEETLRDELQRLARRCVEVAQSIGKAA